MKEIKSNKTQNSYKGSIGESQAEGYLLEQGYEIIETNYKNKIGEIDIIAKFENRIIFVEVKSRATARFGYPREAVDYKKQQKIRMVADIYLKSRKMFNAYIRFDVIEILAGKLTHIISAF